MVWRWHRALGPWALHIWPLSCYLSGGLKISENLCEGPMKVDVSTAGFVSRRVLEWQLVTYADKNLGALGVQSHDNWDPRPTEHKRLAPLLAAVDCGSLAHHPCFLQAWNRDMPWKGTTRLWISRLSQILPSHVLYRRNYMELYLNYKIL